MTTSYGSTGLQAAADIAEDAMEISSEFGQKIVVEEDIDIDLDLGGDQNGDVEDEYMIEDANSMQDEDTLDLQEEELRKDDEMIDEALTPPGMEGELLANDEDLIDAEEESFEPILDLVPDVPNRIDEVNQHDNSDKYLQGQDISDQMADPMKRGDTRTASPKGLLGLTNVQETVSLPRSGVVGEGSPTMNTVHGEKTHDGDSNGEARITRHDDQIAPEGAEIHPIDPSTFNEGYHQADVDAQSLVNVSSTNIISGDSAQYEGTKYGQFVSNEEHDVSYSHADTSIHGDLNTYQHNAVHSVKVLYEENEISLFPPNEEDVGQEQTYLLQDHNLANENIQELLAACRLVLGECIEVHDELRIDIESLDLRFSEVSLVSAKSCSLANSVSKQSTAESSRFSLGQIIDLYLHLQQNDEIDNPSPLCIMLTTKIKLANRLDYLYAAISEGKGLSEISNSSHFLNDFGEGQYDLNQDNSQDLPSYEPGNFESGSEEGENYEEAQNTKIVKGKSHDDKDHNADQGLASNGKSADLILPTTSDQPEEREHRQEYSQYSLPEDAEWYDENFEDGLQASNVLYPSVDDLSDDDKLNTASKVDATGTETNDLGERSIQHDLLTQSTDAESPKLKLVGSVEPFKSKDLVSQSLNAQSQDEYNDNIDDQTEERNHESSAASSTVRGDGSEALAGALLNKNLLVLLRKIVANINGNLDPGVTLGDRKLQDATPDDPLTSGANEEPTNTDSFHNQFVDDNAPSDNADFYSEVDYKEPEEDKDDDASLQHNETEKGQQINEESIARDFETHAHESLTAPDISNNSVFDEDEINYDDEEEVEEEKEVTRKSPLHEQDNHDQVSSTTSSSTPLKRVRTASEDIDFRQNTPQGMWSI